MRTSRYVLALILAAACSGSDGVDPLVATTVLVSAEPTQIAVNETAQASAIVKDQNGNALTGRTIAWTSLNQGVATVTSAGVIKGVSPGNATIKGEVDGVTGDAPITVIAPVPSCTSGPTSVDLATGEARVLSSSSTQGCIKIASTGAESQYLVIAANTNAVPDALVSYAIKSDEGETIPGNTLLTSPYRVASQLALPATEGLNELQTKFEARLRSSERRELDLRVAQRAYATRAVAPELRKSVSAAIPAVGDKTTFKVPAKFDAAGNSLGGSCSKFTSVTATAKHISARAIIYTDDASPAGGFSDTDLQEIGAEFDNLIYPTDVDYFGTPLDLDNNQRVIILYTPLVNKLTPANSNGFVGGFFFVGDLFPSTGTNSCTQSNVAEIFYLLSPDPQGTINDNKQTTANVRQGTRGTIAHEFQHMINGSERIRSPLTEHFESVWLDEALAHYAEDLNGRALAGLTETGNYSDAALRLNNNDYAAFFFQNFARFREYLRNPGPNAPTSQFSDTSLADRGAAWALVRYSADQYAPGGDIKGFIRSLVAGPDTGVVNFRSKIGGTPFETLISGWMVANYADDAGIPNLPATYTYKTYNMRDVVKRTVSSNPANQIYPLKPSIITGSGVIVQNLKARSSSGNYFTFSRAAGAAARTIRMLNNDLASAANFTGASFIVLRTQ